MTLIAAIIVIGAGAGMFVLGELLFDMIQATRSGKD